MNHPLAEQLAAAKKGELDLALLVIDEDAPLVVNVVREMGLQIAGLLAHRRHLRGGSRTFAPVASAPVSTTR